MEIFIHCLMFVFGACFGSFLCCQARRLKLREDKKPKLGARSVCPHCLHQLKWYENLPIISWLVQKGKCRHCHRKIGVAEIISELATGLAFLFVSTAFSRASLSTGFTPFGLFQANTISPLSYAILVATILLVLFLIFLSIYDGLYGELPTFALVTSAVVALVVVILRLVTDGFAMPRIIDTLLAIAVLGGTYLVLYLVSKGKWVGDGDWILGSIIAAVLGTPMLALIVLFLSNFAACIITLPLVKKTKNHKIYFGPFLVLAYIVTLFIASTGVMDYLVSL